LDMDEKKDIEEAQTEQASSENQPWRPQDADREDRKAYIRNRVKNAKVPEGAIFRPAKPKPSIMDTAEKKVAVYARVSTKSEEQVSSIENQTKYYTEKIEKTPNWEMHEIYADEGKSGTSMKKRQEFRRMLADAAAKKMDLILCASVSRFARNMTDCMEQISNLRTANPSHPVGVYFETENIYTLDPDCDQSLSIHAMLADWESANKSRRMILSYDQRICTGQYPVSDLLGYRHTSDGDLVIVEEEALTVRFIFLARMLGYSYEEIADILTEKERKTMRGRTEWNAGMVKNVMSNERRWGDLEARKTIVIDYKKGKTTKNTDIRDAAYVPNHHEGIVTPEIARAVKLIAQSSRNVNGIPDISVIESGGLKGFVSVNPGFSGVDRDTLEYLSSSVYDDAEYEHLQREVRIINGEEHSNILSMDFTGYYVPHSAFFIGRDSATMTISRKQLKFSRKCYEKMGNCEKVELLYHPLLQAIIIRNNEDGFNWLNENGGPASGISARAFCEAVYEEQVWIEDYSFRFRGIKRERGNHKLMIFFLDEPQIVANKATKKAAELVEEEQKQLAARYIPYKKSEIDSTEEEWRKRVGKLYAMRKRRDSLIDSLSVADIAEQGTIVENPLIGKIPTRDEVMDEFEQILLSM